MLRLDLSLDSRVGRFSGSSGLCNANKVRGVCINYTIPGNFCQSFGVTKSTARYNWTSCCRPMHITARNKSDCGLSVKEPKTEFPQANLRA